MSTAHQLSIAQNEPIISSGHCLTSREQEVFEMLCQGYSTKEIASKLYLSPHTVVSHRQSIMDKCGARNTVHMVYKLLQRPVNKK